MSVRSPIAGKVLSNELVVGEYMKEDAEAKVVVADLLAARAGVSVAHSELQVTRRERMPDIDLSLGVSHNSQVLNVEAPAPRGCNRIL